MPFCPQCKFIVSASFNYCPSCGFKLKGDDTDTKKTGIGARTQVKASLRISSLVISGLKGFYEGFTLDGKPHGRGKVSWDNGDSFEGGWEDGIIKGRGTYIWNNGNRYEGEWSNGRMEGKGKLEVRSNGVCSSVYQGTFSNGIMNGEGLLCLIDIKGNSIGRYAGKWKEGSLSGPFRYYSSSGYLDCEEWDNGINGKAVDEKGISHYYYHGTRLISKEKGLFKPAIPMKCLVKYENTKGSVKYSNVVGVYLLEENAEKALKEEEDGLYSWEVITRIDIPPHAVAFPSSRCYIVLQTFFESNRKPEIISCCPSYESAKETVTTWAHIDYPSDREVDYDNKCCWQILEASIMDMPDV